MIPFATISGPAAPLPQPNIDTDVIIRVDRLATLDRNALGLYAFEPLRYLPNGVENSDFVLNKVPWRSAPILVTGSNFGCGSSREAAVWALAGTGIRCVIATSFGDIFFDNCFNNGLLPVRLPGEVLERLMCHAQMGKNFEVNLSRQEIVVASEHVGFAVDPWRRECLLNGLDGIDLTLKNMDTIVRWQEADQIQRPWTWRHG